MLQTTEVLSNTFLSVKNTDSSDEESTASPEDMQERRLFEFCRAVAYLLNNNATTRDRKYLQKKGVISDWRNRNI